MNVNNFINTATKEFKQNLEDLCQNQDFSALTQQNALDFCEGLKSALSHSGQIAFKTYLENFEHTQNTVVHEDETYRFKNTSSKKFLTPFGEIQLTRRSFQSNDSKKSFIPLDENWGMVGEYATFDVKEAICFSCGLVTPEETAFLLQKSSLFHPSATAIKHIVVSAGQFTEENKLEIDSCIRSQESIPHETKAVVFSLDGANVLLNEPGVKKGRKTQRPKSGEQNDDKTSFRNAMVGSVSCYTTQNNEPTRLESRYVSQMPEPNFLNFKDNFEAEVKSVKEKLPSGVKKLVIVDGHHSIRGYLEGHELFKDCDYLIDFFHATEYLSKAAETIFGKSTEGNKIFYSKWKDILKKEEYGAERLLRSLKYYRSKMPRLKKKHLNPMITYFRKHKSHMHYVKNYRQGLPIGSGPVEAACKSIVKTRMCRSGMRWSREGGQNILNFRTYIKSNRWEAYWNQYKEWKLAA